MKGQTSVEYYISITVFLFFIALIIARTAGVVPEYTNQVKIQELRSEAYALSEILLNNPGIPGDWESFPPEAVTRFGLASGDTKLNLLSSSKLSALRAICSNPNLMDEMRESMNAKFRFSIIFTNRVSGDTFSCEDVVTPISTAERASISRVAAIDNGQYGELIVQVSR